MTNLIMICMVVLLIATWPKKEWGELQMIEIDIYKLEVEMEKTKLKVMNMVNKLNRKETQQNINDLIDHVDTIFAPLKKGIENL